MEGEESPKENVDDSMANFNPMASSSFQEGEQPEGNQEENKPPPATSAPPMEQPERPMGPMQDTDKIISETKDILDNLIKIMVQQRHFLFLCGYQINAIDGMVKNAYTSMLDSFRNFLVHNDVLQKRWFMKYYEDLPRYGEYEFVLKDVTDKVKVDGVPIPVEPSELLEVAQDVIQCLYSGGLNSQAMMFLGVNIGNKMDAMKEVTKEEYLPYESWLLLCAKQVDHFETLDKKCFDVVSVIDFMKAALK